jgi:hypothetical protein
MPIADCRLPNDDGKVGRSEESPARGSTPHTGEARSASGIRQPVTATGRAVAGSAIGNRKSFPFHPWLFAAYPVLQLFAYNIAEVRFAETLAALVCALALAGLAVALAWILLKDLRKAAVLASLFVWLFFSWGNVHLGLSGARIGHFQLSQFWVIGAFFLATLVVAGVAVRRTRSNLLNLSHILDVGSLFLVVSCIVVLSARTVKQQSLPGAGRPGLPTAHARPGPGYNPDIYFILLDQYPRSDSLKLMCDGDNQPFLDGLRKLGFYVADRSASNYPRTVTTIASMLNMSYLDEKLLGPVKEDCQDLNLAAKAVAHNAVFDFVQDRGYRTVYLPCEYGAGNCEDADLRLKSGASLSEFNKYVLEMTPIETVEQWLGWGHSTEELHRRHLLFTLESLRKLPRMGASPFFVYAHLLCPHTPIVWGADGEKILSDPAFSERQAWKRSPESRRLYADQVTYLSKLVEETVAEIIHESADPPVIIICSDHGTEFEVDWSSAKNSNMQERMANLAAFYFPQGGDRLLYPTITNVNFFRIVLDAYFGTKYGLLPDESYFSTDDKPYRFIRVPMDGPLKHWSKRSP